MDHEWLPNFGIRVIIPSFGQWWPKAADQSYANNGIIGTQAWAKHGPMVNFPLDKYVFLENLKMSRCLIFQSIWFVLGLKCLEYVNSHQKSGIFSFGTLHVHVTFDFQFSIFNTRQF